MDIQLVIVVAIVILAVLFLVRKYTKVVKRADGCGCSGNCCGGSTKGDCEGRKK